MLRSRYNNLDSSLYEAHSFRIGAASWAAAKGFSDSQIRLLGRWKSNAFLKYIRTPSLDLLIANQSISSVIIQAGAVLSRLKVCQQSSGGAGRWSSDLWPFSWPSPLLELKTITFNLLL